MTTQATSGEGPRETNTMYSTQLTISNKRLWASRLMSGLPALFLLMDGGMKLFKPPVVVEATSQLGYPESTIVGIGLVLLISTILYLIPRTAILGAILLTGYLGGAVATHVRLRAVLFNIIFPVLCGALLWGRPLAAGSSSARSPPLTGSVAATGATPRSERNQNHEKRDHLSPFRRQLPPSDALLSAVPQSPAAAQPIPRCRWPALVRSWSQDHA